jgi:nitrogen fixation/metabolism regulation signal transduction histidine kinase
MVRIHFTFELNEETNLIIIYLIDSLKKMFNNFCPKDDAPNLKAKKLKAEESIQELMTLTQFANDESDYGMALELGQCMFSFGEQGLHKYIKNLLSISYTLLDRNHYSDIIKAHLSNRQMKVIS